MTIARVKITDEMVNAALGVIFEDKVSRGELVPTEKQAPYFWKRHRQTIHEALTAAKLTMRSTRK